MAALLIFCLLLSLTGCGLSEDPVLTYLVSVTAEDTSGSGILYETDENCLYVLTAAHVLSGSKEDGSVVVRFYDGWEISCGNIRFSQTSDLALIEIAADQVPKRQRYSCASWDKESFDGLQTGAECTAVGSVKDSGCVRYEGRILDPWIYMEDYNQYMIWADAHVQPGMSGGGLLDGEGRLLGILSGGSEDGELAAVPLSLVLQFMTDLGR